MQYRTKGLTVEARQFLDTNTVADLKDLQAWVVGFIEVNGDGVLEINTTKGQLGVCAGTWLVKLPDGNLTFMSPTTFQTLFEPVPV